MQVCTRNIRGQQWVRCCDRNPVRAQDGMLKAFSPL
jgi:hypothetical protein